MDIKNRWDGSILYSSSLDTLKEAIVEAIRKKVNLREKDISLYGLK